MKTIRPSELSKWRIYHVRRGNESLYVGQSSTVYKRLTTHFDGNEKKHNPLIDEIGDVDTIEIDLYSYRECLSMFKADWPQAKKYTEQDVVDHTERKLIEMYSPKCNVKRGRNHYRSRVWKKNEHMIANYGISDSI